MSILLPLWPLVLAATALLVAGLLGLRSADPMRQVRGRLWLAIAVFGVALLASWGWGTAVPSLLGLPIVVGPGVAAIAGVLAFTAPAAPATGSATRRASLRVRSVRQVLGRRALLLPATLLVLLVATLLVTGSTADASGETAGRAFSVTRSDLGAGGGPYPGWFYGVPILVTCSLLVLAVWLAAHRTAYLPAVSADDATDAAWRAAVGRALGAIATAALALYLAGVLWAAGVVWRVLGQVGSTGLEPLAVAQGVASGAAAVVAVVVLIDATVRVATIGRTVADARRVTA